MGYKWSKQQKERHSKLMKEWHKNNEHPKGTLGKNLKPNQTSFKKGNQIAKGNKQRSTVTHIKKRRKGC